MILSSAYRKCRLALCALGLLAAVTGCVSRVEQPDGENGKLRMSLTVLANGSVATRAGHADDGEEKGSDAENYIDFAGNDFRIVLFDRSGNYLYEIDGLGGWDSFTSGTMPGGADYYRLEYEIDLPESVDAAKRAEIRSNGVQVMVLANWHGIDGSVSYGPFTGRTLGGDTGIWSDRTRFNFSYPYGTTATPAAGFETWRPDIEKKRLIPMFGINTTPAFVEQGEYLFAAVTVPMQRAVAKIEVLDNLVNQPALSVGDVTMTSFNTSGRFIPDVAANPGWAQVGSQVGISSLPANVVSRTGLNFYHDAAAKKWIAYVPEMALTPATDSDPDNFLEDRPHLEVVISAKDLGFYEGGTYPVHFAKYVDSAPTFPDESWDHILRNHIYRFSVNKVGVTVDLHLHVIPWQADDEELWDFTDHVTVQDRLFWDTETYASYDPETESVTLLLDKEKPLKGYFTISTPINGRWYVRLTALDGAKTDAIVFCEADGTELGTEISGLIPLEAEFPTMFFIKPTNLGNDDESRFRLDFFVENLGVWMEVPMVENANGIKYYTIVRESNNIIG